MCCLLGFSHSESADKVVLHTGKYEELIVCSHEIAASTAQLVASSKVRNKLTQTFELSAPLPLNNLCLFSSIPHIFPQGSILASVLICFNDLGNGLQPDKLHPYADDTVIYSKDPSLVQEVEEFDCLSVTADPYMVLNAQNILL